MYWRSGGAVFERVNIRALQAIAKCLLFTFVWPFAGLLTVVLTIESFVPKSTNFFFQQAVSKSVSSFSPMQRTQMRMKKSFRIA